MVAFIPLSATVFSSGYEGGFYGYAFGHGVSASTGTEVNIAGAFTYYSYLGESMTLYDTIDNSSLHNSSSPYLSTNAWDKLIDGNLGRN